MTYSLNAQNSFKKHSITLKIKYKNCDNLEFEVLIYIQMQRLAEAKVLTGKAETFLSEGNYDYAIRCYDKLNILLRDALKEAKSPQTLQQIKSKIDKFTALKTEAQAKKKQKETEVVKISKFGFPVAKVAEYFNLKKNAQLPVKKLQINVKRIQNNEKKPMMKHHQLKTEKNNIDPSVEELIVKNIDISFKDIVGLTDVKSILEQAVIRPRQRPDLYKGIRAPPKGILLYGPPGNGKTYICKALARESGCTFFALSASSILNKLVGESEKTIKRIFEAAQKLAPSIIFIDEIDSMLTARSQNENDASRRLKTEFLVLMDGINSPKSGEVLVIGATNLPKELDSAAKRRFSKMIYIGHPGVEARKEMLLRNLNQIQYDLSNGEMNKIVDKLEYFSASQIRNIVAEVCMIPLRELERSKFQKIANKDLRKIGIKDFMLILNQRKPILSKEELAKYKENV